MRPEDERILYEEKKQKLLLYEPIRFPHFTLIF